MTRLWFRRAIAVAIVPLMTGCTAALWTPATQATAVEPEISGLVRNYPARGDRSLVIRYRARGDGTDVNLVVPVASDGTPVSPFAVNGTAFIVRYPGSPESHPTAGRVSDQQTAEIASREKAIPADRQSLASHFNAADWVPATGVGIERDFWGSDQAGTLCLLAYRMNDAGQIEVVSPDHPGTAAPASIVLPKDAHLVLVPKIVDRVPGDRTRNVLVATALTPVSVAADAAGTGIVIGAIGVTIPFAVIALPFAGSHNADHPTTGPSMASASAKQDHTSATVPVYVGKAPTTNPVSATQLLVGLLGN